MSSPLVGRADEAAAVPAANVTARREDGSSD